MAAALLAILVFVLGILTKSCVNGVGILCPTACSCLGSSIDCSRRALTQIPSDIPQWVTVLDLSNNDISSINQSAFVDLNSLTQLNLANNALRSIPQLDEVLTNLTTLLLSHNQINSINSSIFSAIPHLETLDLNYNAFITISVDTFPTNCSIQRLYLNSNDISSIDQHGFANLTSLKTLKLNKNSLKKLSKEVFNPLVNLTVLELNKNKLRKIESLMFHMQAKLRILKLRRNGIASLDDGAFYGMDQLEELYLDNNKLESVMKGWLYGLKGLKHLSVSCNNINYTAPLAFCTKLEYLDLSQNQLVSLVKANFEKLPALLSLNLSNNVISSFEDGSFRGLTLLTELNLNNNDISWTIEDSAGAFKGLSSLLKLGLVGNRIKSITKKSFADLTQLEILNLKENMITTIQSHSFSGLPQLKQLLLNTSSLLCDCQLTWFPGWLVDQDFPEEVIAKCAHPQVVQGQNVVGANISLFTCADYPKPHIIIHPETQKALRSEDVEFICQAASNGGSTIEVVWKKDNKELPIHLVEVTQEMQGGVTEVTSILRLTDVQDEQEGRYQCIISNHFGASYSDKAKLTVNVFPSFTRRPEDKTVKVGEVIPLECAATGDPTPDIAWQKDGGIDFPAARGRRLHVYPDDEVFFIANSKLEDMGIYTCIATNDAGTIIVNATIRVLELPSFAEPPKDVSTRLGDTAVLQCKPSGNPKPVIVWSKDGTQLEESSRLHLANNNQLLLITDLQTDDAGTYYCSLSNLLGKAKASLSLKVTKDSCHTVSSGQLESNVCKGAFTGIIIIAVVCGIVGTSVVWVVIIYQSRKRRQQYKTTSVEDPMLPVDTTSSAYNGSEGTIQQETSSGVSSSATDKYQMDNLSDDDSIDGPLHASYRLRQRFRDAAVFPSESHMEEPMLLNMLGRTYDNTSRNDGNSFPLLNQSLSNTYSPPHIATDYAPTETDPLTNPDMYKEIPPQVEHWSLPAVCVNYPGCESKDNEIVTNPYHPRDLKSPAAVANHTAQDLYHQSEPPGGASASVVVLLTSDDEDDQYSRHGTSCTSLKNSKLSKEPPSSDSLQTSCNHPEKVKKSPKCHMSPLYRHKKFANSEEKPLNHIHHSNIPVRPTLPAEISLQENNSQQHTLDSEPNTTTTASSNV